MTEESKLEKEVEKYMKERKIWQLARFQAQYSQNGLPDRLYLYKGLLLGLELKTDKGKPTNLQLKKLKVINDNGGIGVVIRNVNDVKELIKIIDNSDSRIIITTGYSKSYKILQEYMEYEESKN